MSEGERTPSPTTDEVSDRVLTVPNVLSALRLVGVPVFLWLLFNAPWSSLDWTRGLSLRYALPILVAIAAPARSTVSGVPVVLTPQSKPNASEPKPKKHGQKPSANALSRLNVMSKN